MIRLIKITFKLSHWSNVSAQASWMNKASVLSGVTPRTSPRESFIILPLRDVISCTSENSRGGWLIISSSPFVPSKWWRIPPFKCWDTSAAMEITLMTSTSRCYGSSEVRARKENQLIYTHWTLWPREMMLNRFNLIPGFNWFRLLLLYTHCADALLFKILPFEPFLVAQVVGCVWVCV